VEGLKHMIRNKLLAALLSAALLTLAAATIASPAQAQDCGYGGCTTTTQGQATTTTGSEIPTVTVVQGETVDVEGSGCEPGAEVVVTFDDGTVLGTFTADENGDFVTTITIPANATVGVHLVTATCGDLQQFLNVNVLAATEDNPGVDNGTLPRTGSSNTGPLLGIGAAAIVLGAAFVYGSRRPRTTD
jgi:LPXTG-motif cell wall-anchored protein